MPGVRKPVTDTSITGLPFIITICYFFNLCIVFARGFINGFLYSFINFSVYTSPSFLTLITYIPFANC